MFVPSFNHSCHTSLIFTQVTFLVAGGWHSGTFTSEWRCLSTAGNPQGLPGSDSGPLSSDRIIGEFASETRKRAFQGPSETCLLIQASTLNVVIISLSKISENCSLFSNPFSILLFLITGCSADMEKTAQPFSSACGNPQVLPHFPLPAPPEKPCVVLQWQKKSHPASEKFLCSRGSAAGGLHPENPLPVLGK